jgi:hypothetical protein
MSDNFRDGLVLAWLHPGQVTGAFCGSVSDTILYDGAKKGAIVKYGGILHQNCGPRIHAGRCDAVGAYLQTPSIARAKWFLMVDADMKFTPQDVYTLLESAHPTDRPIVGGLCFAGGRGEDLFPTIYNLDREEDGTLRTEPIMDYPRDAMVKVGATGAAFLLVHQWVFKKMYEKFSVQPNGSPNPYPWFTEGVDKKGRPFGEDVGFCVNAQAVGAPIHVNTAVKIGHTKSYELTEELWDEKRAAGYKTPHEEGRQMLKIEESRLG